LRFQREIRSNDYNHSLFSPLKEGAAYEVPLFGNCTKFLFARYIRIAIISKWEKAHESDSPEGAQFSEIAFYGFPEGETETGAYQDNWRSSSLALDCSSVVFIASMLQVNYKIPYNGRVILSVHDILGRTIQTLVEERKKQGSYSMNWTVPNIPNGVYFLKLQSGGGLRVKKIVIMK
jgi:hypothetical protein